jgi:hypothetical protein
MSRTWLRRPAASFVVTLSAFVASAELVRADLQFKQTTVDVGEAKRGSPLAHEFTFVNSGPESAEIVEIQVSCGCLRPDLEPRVYKPGVGGKLRIEVNTLTQDAGPHSWRTVVRYRQGGAERETALVLTATVVVEIAVQPPQLSVLADQAISHELRLIDLREKTLTITAVQATSPKLSARVIGESRDVQGHLTRTLRLDVAPDFPEGRHEETLNIYTDDSLYRHLKVPVTITKRVRQRFTALPNAVTLTAPRGQPFPSKIVLIRDSENNNVEIERLTPSDPAIGCTWARGPGANATLRITVDRARLQGDCLRANVEVKIAKPATETMTIPVTVGTP